MAWKEADLEGSWHWDPQTEKKGWERRADIHAESQGSEMKVVGTRAWG